MRSHGCCWRRSHKLAPLTFFCISTVLLSNYCIKSFNAFVLTIILYQCHFCWPPAIRSRETCFIALVPLIIFLYILVAVLFVWFCKTILICRVFRQLNVWKNFLEAGWVFSGPLCLFTFALMFCFKFTIVNWTECKYCKCLSLLITIELPRSLHLAMIFLAYWSIVSFGSTMCLQLSRCKMNCLLKSFPF